MHRVICLLETRARRARGRLGAWPRRGMPGCEAESAQLTMFFLCGGANYWQATRSRMLSIAFLGHAHGNKQRQRINRNFIKCQSGLTGLLTAFASPLRGIWRWLLGLCTCLPVRSVGTYLGYLESDLVAFCVCGPPCRQKKVK